MSLKVEYTGILMRSSENDHTRSFFSEDFAKEHPNLVEDMWINKKNFDEAVALFESARDHPEKHVELLKEFTRHILKEQRESGNGWTCVQCNHLLEDLPAIYWGHNHDVKIEWRDWLFERCFK